MTLSLEALVTKVAIFSYVCICFVNSLLDSLFPMITQLYNLFKFTIANKIPLFLSFLGKYSII